jgi:hypothetical protein
MCRKFHGAAFGTLVDVKNLNWHTGEHLLKEFIAPIERYVHSVLIVVQAWALESKMHRLKK